MKIKNIICICTFLILLTQSCMKFDGYQDEAYSESFILKQYSQDTISLNKSSSELYPLKRDVDLMHPLVPRANYINWMNGYMGSIIIHIDINREDKTVISNQNKWQLYTICFLFLKKYFFTL